MYSTDTTVWTQGSNRNVQELTRSVNLGGVLAREGTPTMGSPATVCVNDDLATSEASIPVRASNHKPGEGNSICVPTWV